MRMLVLGASLLALAACGGESAAPKTEAQAKPAKLPAGEWEVTSTVQSLRSADNSTPAIDLKEGQATTARVCVADGALPAKLFTGNDDPCTTDTAYNRNPHYHQASDTPETLDYPRMAMVTLGLAAMLKDLADENPHR